MPTWGSRVALQAAHAGLQAAHAGLQAALARLAGVRGTTAPPREPVARRAAGGAGSRSGCDNRPKS